MLQTRLFSPIIWMYSITWCIVRKKIWFPQIFDISFYKGIENGVQIASLRILSKLNPKNAVSISENSMSPTFPQIFSIFKHNILAKKSRFSSFGSSLESCKSLSGEREYRRNRWARLCLQFSLQSDHFSRFNSDFRCQKEPFYSKNAQWRHYEKSGHKKYAIVYFL